MDIHSKTLSIFKGFIDDLVKVFPEHKITLYENYSDILGLETKPAEDAILQICPAFSSIIFFKN